MSQRKRKVQPASTTSARAKPAHASAAAIDAPEADRHWALDGIVAVVVTHGYVSKLKPGTLLESAVLDVAGDKVKLKSGAKGKVQVKHFVQYLVKFDGYPIDPDQLLEASDFHDRLLAPHAFARLEDNGDFMYDHNNKAHFLPVSAEHFDVQVLESIVCIHDLDAYLDRADYPANDVRTALEHRSDFSLLGKGKKSPRDIIEEANWFNSGTAPNLEKCSMECLRKDPEFKDLFRAVDKIVADAVKIDSAAMLQRVLNPFFDDSIFSQAGNRSRDENTERMNSSVRYWFGRDKSFYLGLAPLAQDLPTDAYDDAYRESATDPEDAADDASGPQLWPAVLRRISVDPWSTVTKREAKKIFAEEPDGLIIFERAQGRFHMPKSVSEVYKKCLISGLPANCMTQCGHPFVRAILKAWWHHTSLRGDADVVCPGCFAKMTLQPFPTRILARERPILFVKLDPTRAAGRRFNPQKYHEVDGIYYLRTRRAGRGGKKVQRKKAQQNANAGQREDEAEDNDKQQNSDDIELPANANGKRPTRNDNDHRPWKRLTKGSRTDGIFNDMDFLEVAGPEDPLLMMDTGSEDEDEDAQLDKLSATQQQKIQWLQSVPLDSFDGSSSAAQNRPVSEGKTSSSRPRKPPPRAMKASSGGLTGWSQHNKVKKKAAKKPNKKIVPAGAMTSGSTATSSPRKLIGPASKMAKQSLATSSHQPASASEKASSPASSRSDSTTPPPSQAAAESEVEVEAVIPETSQTDHAPSSADTSNTL